MSGKRVIRIVLVASAVMLAVVIGLRFAGSAFALPSAQAGVTIPYTGSLTEEDGQPVADGAYDFTFAVYDAKVGGEPLWTEVQEGVLVQGGAFTVLLGGAAPLATETLEAGARLLEVAVRGPGEAEFTALTPRQELSASTPTSLTSPSTGPACAHDHLNESWIGSNLNPALSVTNQSTGIGILGISNSTAANAAGVYGISNGDGGIGVGAESYSGPGVYARNWGGTSDKAALRAENFNPTNGMAAYMNNNSGFHTAHFYNAGTGGVLYLQNGSTNNDGTGGYDFITAINSAGDYQFVVTSAGAGYADGGWQGAADYAELMTTEGEASSYEPGDVLVVSVDLDRSVALSSEPYSTLVIGVYSEKPGFVGSPHVMEGQRDDEIPVAVLGIVPVKVSAENGPISRGDLLITSSTPGHAMRADNPVPGTILGKALEPLESGTGVILVLITLQ